MPIRRGEEYLESLRDGRRVWLMGQRVEDVTSHPALAGCARSVAAVYDLQHDPAHQELLTMPSPTTRQRGSLAYLLPRSVDELARQRRASPHPEDHPVSHDWDEMDAIVVFDNVFIPWERVFYLRRSPAADLEFEGRLFQGAVGLGPWYVLVRMAVKAEVLLGLCAAITDALGTAGQPLVQMAMADAMVYLETLRALIQAAEANPVPTPSGLILPNPTMAMAGRICAIERYPHLLQIIRELCGSGLLMAPGQADMNNPEIGPHLHRYVVGKDTLGPEYFRMLKLAWEYACDSFGSRQLLFEMYNVSSLATNKQRLASAYDTSPFVALAKELAGITGGVDNGGGQGSPEYPGMQETPTSGD